MNSPEYIELKLVKPEFAQATMDFVEHKLPLAKAIRQANTKDIVDWQEIEGVTNPTQLLAFKLQYDMLKAKIQHAWEHEECEQELREEMREFGIDKPDCKIIFKEVLYHENDIPVVKWEGKVMPIIEIENILSANLRQGIAPSN